MTDWSSCVRLDEVPGTAGRDPAGSQN